jgi:hypothetical protein
MIRLGFLTQSPLFAESLILEQEQVGNYNQYDEFISGAIVQYQVKGSVTAAGGKDRSNTVTGERSDDIINIAFNRKHILSALDEGNNPKKGDIIVWYNQRYRISNTKDYPYHDFINVVAIRLDGEND